MQAFREQAEITEYELPEDCTYFFTTCENCISSHERPCKCAVHLKDIEDSLLKADLIVMTVQAHVFFLLDAVKALYDHFVPRMRHYHSTAERFMRSVLIITQYPGKNLKNVAKSIKRHLSLGGISEITVFSGSLIGDVAWDPLPDDKKAELTQEIAKLSKRYTSELLQKKAES